MTAFLLRVLRRLARIFPVLALAGVFMAITHTRWLPLVYRALDVTEPPGPTEALIVLGGGDTRDEGAALLYPVLGARVVVVSGGPVGVALDRESLIAQGVPDSAIAPLPISASTIDEAYNVLAFLHAGGYRSATLITDREHSRRALATFRCVNARMGYGIDVQVAAAPEEPFFAQWWTGWWPRQRVLSEYVKIPAYALLYGVVCY